MPQEYVKVSGKWEPMTGGSGPSDLTGLNDVPDSYAGQEGKALVVNDTATGIKFVEQNSGTSDPRHRWLMD